MADYTIKSKYKNKYIIKIRKKYQASEFKHKWKNEENPAKRIPYDVKKYFTYNKWVHPNQSYKFEFIQIIYVLSSFLKEERDFKSFNEVLREYQSLHPI